MTPLSPQLSEVQQELIEILCLAGDIEHVFEIKASILDAEWNATQGRPSYGRTCIVEHNEIHVSVD